MDMDSLIDVARRHINWNIILQENDVNVKVDILNQNILHLFNIHAPLIPCSIAKRKTLPYTVCPESNG